MSGTRTSGHRPGRPGSAGRRRRARVWVVGLGVLAVLAAGGCGRPHAANIALRKENQALRDEVRQLRLMRQADIANRFMAVGETGSGVSLDRLFTAHGLRVGRLTGIYGQTLRVFVVPTDQTGDLLKAAGSFEIRAFDLDLGERALVAAWRFTDTEAAAAWNGQLLQYGYVLECPLPAPIPPDETLTVQIIFTDLLTGRRLETETVARVRSMPAQTPPRPVPDPATPTAPATRPLERAGGGAAHGG